MGKFTNIFFYLIFFLFNFFFIFFIFYLFISWWYGKNIEGEEGYFPSTLCDIFEEEKKSTSVRGKKIKI